MYPFGVIGGTNLFHSRLFKNMEKKVIDTPYGNVELYTDYTSDLIFIPRHGIETRIPPHRINHHANIYSLKSEGVRWVLGISSVGSLKQEIPPGTFMIPDDYIQFTDIPTFFDQGSKHVTPSLSHSIRQSIFRIATDHGFNLNYGGVYVQTTGPRFETAAEIRFFSTIGDIVGMDMASEATLTMEMELNYGNLSVVDNFANGISGEITYDEFIKLVKSHQDTLDGFLEILLPELQKEYK